MARNRYNDLIVNAKKVYYNNRLNTEKNPKKIHHMLDELSGLKKEKTLPEVTSDFRNLANDFANFFEDKIERIYLSIVGDNLYNPITTTPVEHSKFCKFKELTMNKFDMIMRKVKYTYCESDPLPINDVKDAKNFDQLRKLYYDIVNMSLGQAAFPNSEKLACIKPAYKNKGDKESLSSYRPISNLSYLSKIIETTVHEQTWEYLKQANIIPENQSAYRENHSTETTVCAVINDMTDIIANGKCGILVMLDLSAAFDTVDHNLLLKDLSSVGITEDVHLWYKSYLENRSSIVMISNEKSMTKRLSKGVPQGSVLGPLLFCIYTIELSNILKKHTVKFKLFADDTQFYFPVENIEDAKNKINAIMIDIKRWMIVKKLKLNEEKTECMLFGSVSALKKYENFQSICIGSSNIDVKKVVKNLGVLIDNKLSMKNHILHIVKTCNYYIRNIAFIRKYLTEDTLKTVIYNHVLSRLDYCNAIYHGLQKYLLKKLQGVQNRAARLIKGIRPRDRITPTLMELHWLPMKARIEYKILLLTYKALKLCEPKYLADYLSLFRPESNVTVRHASETNRLSEPRTNCALGERAFNHCAPRLFNKLPPEIKNIDNVMKFKKDLKTYLFTKCYDTENKCLNINYAI